MVKLLKKLRLALLPVAVYFGIFIAFEPYNYFGIRKTNFIPDSAIVRVRNYAKDPRNVVIVGDSRMAHFDLAEVEEYVGEKVGQLSFGGASFNESMDLLEYALKINPDIDTVYFGVSFYTLNESYYKDRMSSIKTIAENPLAYMLNFNYNIEMLNNIKNTLAGRPALDREEIGNWTEEDYLYEDGSPRPYRKNLMEYVDTIYPVCRGYVIDRRDIERYFALCQSLKEQGVMVYTVLPPMDISVKKEIVDKLGIAPDLLKFIEDAGEYSQVLNYEYTESPVFTEDQFYDGFHLDMVTGLPAFTQMLFER